MQQQNMLLHQFRQFDLRAPLEQTDYTDMEITFIGHQSWLVSHESTHILIDPILTDRFGSDNGIEIYPPRTVAIDHLPPLSAILISHEHSDHFHLPSLNKLSRDTEVIVGVNMIAPVVDALVVLGFRVRRQFPFESFKVGTLVVTFYPAADETVFWESRVNQFLLHPTDRQDDAFFIAVDALVSSEYLESVADGSHSPPAAVAVSNNAQITPFGVFGSLDNLTDLRGEHSKKGLFGLQILTALIVEYLEGLSGCTQVFICGGGFMKDYSELGPFPFSNARELSEAANALCSNRLCVHGPYPGDVFSVNQHSPICCTPAPFITLDRDRFRALEAQSKNFISRGASIEMVRISTQSESIDEMRQSIAQALHKMASPLVRSSLGRLIYSTREYLCGPLGSRRFVICLLQEDEGTIRWALDLAEGSFVPLQDDTETMGDLSHLLCAYPFGIMAHLADFYAVVAGKVQIWDIAGIALRAWYIGPAESSPVAFLYSWFGEQLQPDLHAEHYRRKLRELGYTC